MSSLDNLKPEIREGAIWLFDVAKRAGVNPRVTSTVRSTQTQQRLYEAFLAGHSKYPAAPPGLSAHEYGYAFDMVVEGALNQADLGGLWVQSGGVYGGEEDPIHFEVRGFKSWLAGQLGTALPARTNKPGTRDLLARLVDLFLGFLPGFVGSIVSTAGLSNAILAAAGRDQSKLAHWVSHPQEFFDDVYDLWWAIVSSYF